ncbi:MAG: slipin family protein [Actinobacteria bacterium]|nr:MAG: slipin family protein [Actinomycetota bacterium]
MAAVLIVIAVLLFIALIVVGRSLRVIPEYERAVHFRLGRLQGAKGPGLIVVLPVLDRIIRVSLRTVALEIPTQELVTKDNVTVRVNGVTYYVVRDPIKAVLTVRDFHFATAQKSQVTLLAVLREHDLDSLLRDRESISGLLRGLIDSATEPWGIEVTTAEIKDVELPEQMRRAMAREAESERERRAKVIHARGEFEAAEMLGQAASVLEQHPAALQLRTLATLAEISVERNSTIVFPLPFEVMRVFDAMARKIEGEIAGPPPAVAEPAPLVGSQDVTG